MTPYPVVPEARPLVLPRPWTEDVVYSILLDRFHRVGGESQPPFHGGNIAGLRSKLDYLTGLGVTALLVSPVLKNKEGGFHGRWPVDFYSVDQRFGTMEELQGLVQECHRRGFRFLLDLPLNHPDDAVGLALWWAENAGVDGLRLEAARGTAEGFWPRLTAALKERYPDLLTMRDEPEAPPDALARLQSEDRLDSVLDSSFLRAAREGLIRDSEEPGPGFLSRVKGLWRDRRRMPWGMAFGRAFGPRPTDMRRLAAVLPAQARCPRPELLATCLDRHELSRFLSEADGSRERVRLALALLLCWRGLPVLAYGTESGLSGLSDPALMDFESEPDLRAYVRQLIWLRRGVSALREGSQTMLLADRQVLVFLRDDHETRAICAVNNSSEAAPRLVALPRAGRPAVWLDALTGERMVETDGKLELPMRPRSARVLVEGWRVDQPGSAQRRLSVMRASSGGHRNRRRSRP